MDRSTCSQAQMARYSCPICEKPDNVVLWAESNFDEKKLNSFSFSSRSMHEPMHLKLMHCKKCDLVFSVDVKDLSHLTDMYVSADYSSANEARLASKTYIEYVRKKIPTLPKSALDIGTGEGSFLEELRSAGVEDVVGIEPSQAAINSAADESSRELIINDFFPSEQLAGRKFELVTLFQTIEHIPDPVSLLQNIYDTLEDNGLMFIVCHDCMQLFNKILGKKSLIYDVQHLQLFSSKSLYHIAKKVGFTDIRVFHIQNRYPLSYWTKLLPLPYNMKTRLVKFLNLVRIGRVNIPIHAGNVALIAAKGDRK